MDCGLCSGPWAMGHEPWEELSIHHMGLVGEMDIRREGRIVMQSNMKWQRHASIP